MKLLIDVRGTLMLGSPVYKTPNEKLIRAIENYYDESLHIKQTCEVIVWSWLEDEAEKACKLFDHLLPAQWQKKEYGTTNMTDIIVDDKPREWEDYAQGASIMTPEFFIERYG